MWWKNLIDNIAYAYDRLRITRRTSVCVTLYLVVNTISEAWHFAATTSFDAIGTAAIIGAIFAPLSGLMGFSLKYHHQGHANQSEQK